MTAYICNKPIATVYTNSDAKYALGQAMLGQLFVKIGESETLYKVHVWGVEGWIFKENADEKVINTSLFNRIICSLNATVYETSDVHSKHLSMLYCGTKVHVLKESEQWSRIEAHGVKGWIFSCMFQTLRLSLKQKLFLGIIV